MSYSGARAWQAAGEGLTGLGSAIAGRRRDKADEAVAKNLRDAAEADRMARWAITLREARGGLGPPPSETATIAGTGEKPMPTFEPPKLFGDADRGVGVSAKPMTRSPLAPPPLGDPAGEVATDARLGADVQEPPPIFRPGSRPTPPSPTVGDPAASGPLTYERPDDSYQAIGDIGHAKTPEALRTEDELAKADAQGRMASAIGADVPAARAGDGAAIGRLMANGVSGADMRGYFPETTPVPPVRGVLSEAGGRRLLVDPVDGHTIRDLGASSSGPDGPDITSRRTIATAAAAALQKERDAIVADAKQAALESGDEGALNPRSASGRLDAVARNFGYPNIAAHQAEMESLRTGGAAEPPPPRPASMPEQVTLGSRMGTHGSRGDATDALSTAGAPTPGSPAERKTAPTADPAVLTAAAEQYDGEPDPAAAMREDGWSEADIEIMMGGLGGP